MKGGDKMLKEKLQMIKSKYAEKGDKKKIENLVVFVIILVITLIVINTIWGNESSSDKEEETSGYKKLAENIDKEESETDELEKKLEEILGKMEGVGDVSVMITYTKGSEIVPMQNVNSKVSTTQETDSDGGTRTIEETDTTREIIYTDGTKVETQTVVNPIVRGAIVIAEGASNATVKTNIVSAVEAITGLATYKVQVFEMNQVQ